MDGRRFARGAAGLLVGALLAMNLGMSFAGAPGDCLVEDAEWSSLEGGCKDAMTGRVWSSARSNVDRGLYDIQPNFEEAQSYCSNLDEGGQTDWRTPTLDEFKTAFANGANGHINNANPSAAKWSATYGSKSRKTAYYFVFEGGTYWATGIYDPRVGFSRHDVICVR